jgi:two-component system OmpR family sensor kinase
VDDWTDKLIAALARLREGVPAALRGLKGTWLILSCGGALCVGLAALLGLTGHSAWAVVLSVAAAGLFLGSNFWFRSRVADPILGLGDTAKRIAGGSYGTLYTKDADNEIGALTDAINDMSVKIGAAARTQTEFISSVSHELRTPLTAITGWGETLLYDEAIQGDSRRGVEIISKEANRLTIMVGELLEFTRMQGGRFTLNMETVDLCAELEEVMFTYGDLLSHENTHLNYLPPEENVLPITGDPMRLKQVILNILDNASKYSRGGGEIDIGVKQSGEYVLLTVRDHGPGIAEKDLPHVKERFYKGNARERGNGIGLAVCDEIITKHGGTLTVGNAPGGGALVTVSLPVRTQ